MILTTAAELEFLLGRFTGAEEMSASMWASAGRATSRSHATAQIADSMVVQRYVQYRDGKRSFEIHAVWMTDPITAEIMYWGFDSAGFAPDPPARGTWHGPQLILERVTDRGSSRFLLARTETGWTWSKKFRAPGTVDWTPIQQATFTPTAAPTTAPTAAPTRAAPPEVATR